MATGPMAAFGPKRTSDLTVRMRSPLGFSHKTMMTKPLDEAFEAIMAHLNHGLEAPPERGLSLSHEAVLESLQWLSAANYGGAVHLKRLRNAGVELKREDGKDIDRWIAEQVRMANIASSVQREYRERNGLAEGG